MSKMPLTRSLRLATGLLLFAYAGSHFLSHATGLLLLDRMEAVGRGVLMAPWRTQIGRGALLFAFAVHAGLGLIALYRRRHLRMPALEAWQLALGLSIPLLLIPHAANVRLGALLYGLDDSYFRIVYQYWITSPASGLPRQFALLLVVWTHGCIGLHFWLRFRPWYRRRRVAFAAVAILIPMLAVLGIMNAGWNATLRAALEPGFAARHGPPTDGTAAAIERLALENTWDELQIAWIALVGLVLALRWWRDFRARRAGTVRIAYPDGRIATVARGFSILEASRWAGVAHASLCGGRGRCSTCRVRILRGAEDLAPPAAAEQATLTRVNAPTGVRLACQVRPQADLAVVPLIRVGASSQGLRFAQGEARELTVTALSVDLRDSTALAAGRLPYDTLFIVDRYVHAVTAAVEANGGYVTSVAGDGIMSVFGLDGDVAAGARGALRAAAALWRAVEQLSVELGPEIGAPLRFGIGLHTGPAVVGSVTFGDRQSLQFLGETGNIAARLEGLTKDRACTMLVSQVSLKAAGAASLGAMPATPVAVCGAEGLALSVLPIHTPSVLEDALAA